MSDERDNDPGEDVGFDKTPEEMTSLPGGSPWFNRKKARIILFGSLCVVALAALVVSNINGSKKDSQASGSSGFSVTPPRSFLESELARANRMQEESEPAGVESFPEETENYLDQWGLPEVSEVPVERQPVVQVQQYQQQPQPAARESQPQLSPLIPRIEGSLFSSSAPTAAAAPAYSDYDPYQAVYSSYPSSTSDYSGLISSLGSPESASESDQNNKLDFYSGASGGSLSGYFLADDALWIGTIIPAVLVTAINTDLPGNIIARVTQNIYDSRTGMNLLIPQGTLLMAQYNSSVSYAQRRVQIVWDILIRPDGYQIELDGMNGVDPQGMAGIKAAYRENWFEYVKAAGIITLFSIANAKLTEVVAERASDEMATAVVTANAEFVRDIGGNLISRALEIQPTLTVSNGERINVMLNKNIFLPPVDGYQVTQKYTLP